MTPARAPRVETDAFRTGTLRFLADLARNNRREWFEANRARYEREVRAPLRALVEEMDVRLATIAPEIVGDPKRSLFRIHRDVRFSNDKSPYHTHAACWFPHRDTIRTTAGGRAAHGGAGFYFHVERDRVRIGGGLWMPPPSALRTVRERLDDDHDALRSLLDEPRLRRRFGALSPDAVLVRMPRGYGPTHPAASLLRHRSFTLGRALRREELLDARLPDRLARDYALLVPFVRWLNGALGLRAVASR